MAIIIIAMKILKSLIKLIVEDQDKTAPLKPRQFIDPKIKRDKLVEELAKQIVKKLGLDSRVKFVNKSSRINGAIAFSVFDKNNKEIILKIQPLNEIDPYVDIMKLKNSGKIPADVLIHLPKIFDARPLSDIGLKSEFYNGSFWEQFGFILTEKLQELPGNLFDLVSVKSVMQKYQAMISDRDVFSKLVAKELKEDKYLTKFIESFQTKETNEVKMKRLHNEIVRAVIYNDDLKKQISKIATDPKLDNVDRTVESENVLMDAIMRGVRLWIDSTKAPEQEALSIMSYIAETIIIDMHKKAIPRQPSDKESATGDLAGFQKINKALKKLEPLGIHFDDLHAGNIMIRPSTGDLVISDIGHFNFK